MAQFKLSQCDFVDHKAVRVVAGDGLHWYGVVLGSEKQVRFVRERFVLPQKENVDILVGEVVAVATIVCPKRMFSVSEVVIDSVVYPDGETFMIKLLESK